MNPLRAISASLNKTLSEDRWASPYMFGVEGGSKYMNLLADDAALSGQWTLATYNNYHNIRNPGSAIKYEINPNFWLMDYIDQLSCLVISKDDMGTGFASVSGTQWRTRYGWIPITKRHVIGCAHALTWASGTWPVNTAQQIPTRIRWRGTDGETIDRIQLHQALGTNPNYGLSDFRDISVAVLDSDLPDSVYIPRMVPNNKRYRRQTVRIDSSRSTQYWLPKIDEIAFSQEWAENVPEKPDESHRAMVHLLYRYGENAFNNMGYPVYQGDSGTPILTVVDGEIMFYGVVGDQTPLEAFKPIPPSALMTEESFINRLIEQADDNAIAMGRMAQRTGYTVTVAPITQFATCLLNSSVANGGLVITSKVPGFYGNRLSVEVSIDDNNGPPVISMDGTAITIRMPRKLSFDASGPFFFNDETPELFTALWYAGDFNSRESFAFDGLPVTWPLDRDGAFVLYAEDAWHMLQRVSGSILMYWKSDSSFMTVLETSSLPKTEENPGGWYGVAAGCTGYVDAHYNVDHTEAQFFPMFVPGAPQFYVAINPRVNAAIEVSLPAGSNGTGRVESIPAKRLSGGR